VPLNPENVESLAEFKELQALSVTAKGEPTLEQFEEILRLSGILADKIIDAH
jgi:hypothetical protein